MTLNFPLLLVIAVAVCGALALVDLVLFAPRRRAAISSYEGQVNEPDPAVLEKLNKEPLLVEYGKSFFPVLFIVLVLDTKVIPIGDPQRGDVMVFRYPSEPNINYIKRVVGLPGDTVRYTKEKRLYVNGELVAEKLVGEEPGTLGSVTLYQEKLGQAEHLIRKEMSRYRIEPDRQWTIPAGHYFMMGDNRDNSNDSRYWNDPKIPKDLLGMVPAISSARPSPCG